MPRSTPMTEAARIRQLYARIYAVVRRIPRGRVATYGQVAELAGIPGGARVAGAALKASSPADRLPWQRVVGKAGAKRGRIAIHDPVGAAIQRALLIKEGIRISDSGHVDNPGDPWKSLTRDSAGVRPSPGISQGHSTPEQGVRRWIDLDAFGWLPRSRSRSKTGAGENA